jgi:2,3-bisphosphoglycerate-dependent phosphoglycerate mutase
MSDDTGLESDTYVHRAQQRYRLPAGARQILLVRHGSSVGATIDTVQLGELSISDPVLADEGHVQARALAERLRDEPIHRIFVTPLRRTQQTAAPLVAAINLDPIVITDLREVHLGDWEHSFYEHALARHPIIDEMQVRESWEVIPNAESMEHFASRVQRGIATLVKNSEADTTSVLFSHAATIAEICRQATNSCAFAFMAPENASVTRLIVERDGQWKLRSFNDVTHLGY